MYLNRRTFVTASVLSAVGLTRVRAQEEQEDAGQLLQMVPGITSAYARKYLPVGSMLPQSTPQVAVTEATPDYLLAMMITFESADTAQTVMHQMLNAEIAAMIMERHAETVTQATDPVELTDRSLFVSDDPEEHHPYASLTVIPMDDLVVLLNTNGMSDAIQPTIDNVANFIAEQPRDDSPIVVENPGIARGGVFEMLPFVDDAEVLGGLEVAWDYDLLVSESPIEPGSASPEASPEHHH